MNSLELNELILKTLIKLRRKQFSNQNWGSIPVKIFSSALMGFCGTEFLFLGHLGSWASTEMFFANIGQKGLEKFANFGDLQNSFQRDMSWN